MTAVAAHPPWHCHPQAIRCEVGHIMTFYKTGYRADLRDMLGHAFLQCQNCAPPTFFFASWVREPSPIVVCYALSKESYDEWLARPGRTPETAELLHVLRDPEGRSHNSSWQAPR